MDVVYRDQGVARTVTVSPGDKIETLGANIMWGGRSLSGDRTFADYGITAGAELLSEL
jgi:hypothetical protein